MTLHLLYDYIFQDKHVLYSNIHERQDITKMLGFRPRDAI